ncbi:MAG: hypothetical protein NTV56_18245 [Alphaproteobacteria bacterium]|nr:hypothetical protein [Alphaproteobacteria bacterium]
MLWRLRRSTSIETGLFQIQAELMQNQNAGIQRRHVRLPEWYDELNVEAPSIDGSSVAPSDHDKDSPQLLAHCFLQVSRLGCGTFDLLTRYETALWRQAAQILFMLQSATRR